MFHLQDLRIKIDLHTDLLALLESAIIEEPPVLIRDGGVIASGYDVELDELRNLSKNADTYLLDLETRERERTGIQTLKVAYNRVHGFYIEVSRTHSAQVPPEYVRRQTLKGAERYILPELKAFEDKVLSSRERALAKEKALYEALLQILATHLQELRSTAQAISELDVLSNFAERAYTLNYEKPELVKQPGLDIVDSRHPVVETTLTHLLFPMIWR